MYVHYFSALSQFHITVLYCPVLTSFLSLNPFCNVRLMNDLDSMKGSGRSRVYRKGYMEPLPMSFIEIVGCRCLKIAFDLGIFLGNYGKRKADSTRRQVITKSQKYTECTIMFSFNIGTFNLYQLILIVSKYSDYSNYTLTYNNSSTQRSNIQILFNPEWHTQK